MLECCIFPASRRCVIYHVNVLRHGAVWKEARSHCVNIERKFPRRQGVPREVCLVLRGEVEGIGEKFEDSRVLCPVLVESGLQKAPHLFHYPYSCSKSN